MVNLSKIRSSVGVAIGLATLFVFLWFAVLNFGGLLRTNFRPLRSLSAGNRWNATSEKHGVDNTDPASVHLQPVTDLILPALVANEKENGEQKTEQKVPITDRTGKSTPAPAPHKASPNQQSASKITRCLSNLCKPVPNSCCCGFPVPASSADQARLVPNLSNVPKEADIIAKYASAGIKPGGSWAPSGCVHSQQLALVIPYRNRKANLMIFLQHMHSYLQAQKLNYTIIVVDQVDELSFNRAMLFNVGILEALKERNYTCFAFHDVDNIPVDPMLSYWCDDQPTHMSSRTDKWQWGLPYQTFAGGVIKQQTTDLRKMNGFATVFWGWGGEDDDIMIRWRSAGMKFQRPSDGQGNYATIKRDHTRGSSPAFDRFALLRTSAQRMSIDGLNTTQYSVQSKELLPLYTHLQVKLVKNEKFEYLYKKAEDMKKDKGKKA